MTTRIVVQILLIALAVPFLISCTGVASDPVDAGLTVADNTADMEIFIDQTYSAEERALQIAARNLKSSLPEIVEAWNVTTLRLLTFRDDGWLSEEKVKIAIPLLRLPERRAGPAGELGRLRNIRQAVEHRAAVAATHDEATARRKHRAEVRKALAGLEGLLPEHARTVEPPCTDLNGVFRRISATTGSGRHLVTTITDGAENCVPALRRVPKPGAYLALVIMLVPEGRGATTERGGNQFTRRTAALKEAVPWAIVVPYFTEDLKSVFAQALAAAKESVREPTRGPRQLAGGS